MRESGRFPYTYACDFIRAIPEKTDTPIGRIGVILSRSDASRIRQEIASVIGISDEELAESLAERFIENEVSV